MDILIGIIITLFILFIGFILLMLFSTKDIKRNDEINKIVAKNPDNYKSYIDSSTGHIVICSALYPNLRSARWTVTHSSIRMVEINLVKNVMNQNSIERIIPFSKISSIQLEDGWLSCFIFVESEINKAGDGSGSASNNKETIDKKLATIHFRECDKELAQAIVN